MNNIRPDMDLALNKAAQNLRVDVVNLPPRYGWGKKSVGAKVFLDGTVPVWLRVQYAERGKLNLRHWNGEIAANEFCDVRKPRIIKHYDWEDQFFVWRATLMTYIADSVCSSTPELREPLALHEAWFSDLKRSLCVLAEQKTERICVRQDLIDRRVKERFGDHVETGIREWVCCHGDLHWANLTFPNLAILDWEGWGLGPRGLDAAFLLSFSGLVPTMAEKIRDVFHDDLITHDGKISLLFAASELLRMIETYGDHLDLKDSLLSFSQAALARI